MDKEKLLERYRDFEIDELDIHNNNEITRYSYIAFLGVFCIIIFISLFGSNDTWDLITLFWSANAIHEIYIYKYSDKTKKQTMYYVSIIGAILSAICFIITTFKINLW